MTVEIYLHPRYQVKSDTDGTVWTVEDTQAKRWNMPVQAISSYVSTRKAAEAIASVLNEEWYKFLDNPS